MNTEKIKAIVDRIPISLIMVLWAGWLGYEYWTFTTAPESPLLQKQAEVDSVKKENLALQVKLKQANDFFKSLDVKKTELRKLAQNLEELKGTLSTNVDIPGFTKMLVTEANRVGLHVLGLRPKEIVSREYYQEQPFELTFRGVYVQLLVYLDRLANVQNIVRVDFFDIHPVSSSAARFVELEGTVQVNAYKYIGTKADEIGGAKSVASSQGVTAVLPVTPINEPPSAAANAAAAKGGH
jgi:Tfp pilus assembly protein PilO